VCVFVLNRHGSLQVQSNSRGSNIRVLNYKRTQVFEYSIRVLNYKRTQVFEYSITNAYMSPVLANTLIERTPPPPGGVPFYYVPSSRTVCKRTPLEEPSTNPSRGILLHTVLDEGT